MPTGLKEFVSKLTWADYLALIVVLRGLYIGFRSGFFPELLRTASYAVAILATFHFKDQLAELLTLKTFLNQTTAQATAFALLLAGVFLLMRLGVAIILKMLKPGEGGFFYRVLGALLGACRWLVILSFVFMLVDYSQLAPLKNDVEDRSVTGPYVARVAPLLCEFFSGLAPQLTVKKL